MKKINLFENAEVVESNQMNAIVGGFSFYDDDEGSFYDDNGDSIADDNGDSIADDNGSSIANDSATDDISI